MISFLQAVGTKELDDEFYKNGLSVYMSYERFKGFIERTELDFGKIWEYSDGWEGFTYRQIGEFHSHRRVVETDNLELSKKLEIIKKAETRLDQIREDAKVASSNTFSSCWSTDPFENEAMWERYAAARDNSEYRGCLVRFNSRLLMAHFSAKSSELESVYFDQLVYGHIEYENFQSFNLKYRNGKESNDGRVKLFKYFKKDIGYHPEKEFRIVALATFENRGAGKDLSFSLGMEEVLPYMSIIAHPDARVNDFEALYKILKTAGLNQLQIAQSKILKRQRKD